MGTTLAALQAGSITYKLVVQIEGYANLITDAPTAAAVTAYAGTDWSQAIGGLTVDVQNSSTLNPWEPFEGGGTFSFAVQPDAFDAFGIDTHRKAAGAETQLSATADRDDTTINVFTAAAFAAAGEAFIGTECFAYTGLTSTSFTGCTRGRYSPFAANGSGAPRFAGYHRFGLDTNTVALAPVVSAQPRVWIGKWVALRMHRYVGGVLDVLAQSLLIFAGRIVEIRDDANTGCTVVDVQHVLDTIKDTTVGRTLVTGQLNEGVFFYAGMQIALGDSCSLGSRTANVLACVASGASGPNQFNAGFYAFGDFCALFNAWMIAENHAGRLYGFYTLEAPATAPDGALHGKVRWSNINGTSVVQWKLTLPGVVALWLGFTDGSPSVTLTTAAFAYFDIFVTGDQVNEHLYQSPSPALRVVILARSHTDSTLLRFDQSIDILSGTFFDQYASLPPPIKPTSSGGNVWGIFMLDNAIMIMGSLNGSTLSNITPVNPLLSGGYAVSSDPGSYAVRGYDRPSGDSTGPVTIRQVLILSLSAATMILSLVYSSGTLGYNSATYDTQSYGIGIGIPGGMLGAPFEASVTNLPGASEPMVVIIDKPTKLSDLLGGDLVLRRASLIWNNGLRFTTLVTPVAVNAVAALTESTKAAPSTTTDASSLRAATAESTDWQFPLVKVNYNLDLTQQGSDNYLSWVTFEDSTTVDDQGGAGDPKTVSARNSYLQAASTGSGIESLFGLFLTTMPLTSRSVTFVTLAIDQRFFETIHAGDTILVTDKFARDPLTGKRGVSSRPGIAVKVSYTLGGMAAGTPTSVTGQTGEVTIYFLGVNRISSYCPGAQVDDTQNTAPFDAGYNAAGPTIRCYASVNSDPSEPVDAASFTVGDVIDIMQIDVASGGIIWPSRTITARAGDDITFTPALSAPAWDDTKFYRIRSSHYGAAQVSQQANVYQGGASGLIESTLQDYQYGSFASPGTYQIWGNAEPAELVTADASGDGLARDTGHERALVRLINGLNDFKTARSSPYLDSVIRENTTYSSGAGFQLLYMRPMFLSLEQNTASCIRFLKVAPFFRSSTGAAVTIRVTFVPGEPSDSTINDISIGAAAVQQTWTTSSTTWATGAEALMNAQRIAPPSGVVWMLVEASIHGQTRGLAECSETYRESL